MALSACGQEPAIIQMKEPQVTLAVTPDVSEANEVVMPVEEPARPEKIFVHVCGAVNQPGVYEMLTGSRVFEAIDLAAGFTDEAHQPSVNLADKVVDGQQVMVPTKEEAKTMPKQATVEAEAGTNLININTADATKLQELSGIGESKAKEIMRHRENNGVFNSIEDIKNVSGIGEKLYERIKENITVD